jgi:di/tricarboxylate transporter
MIMAEGNYTFSDMVKQSLILAVLFCVVTVIWTMTVFPLYA